MRSGALASVSRTHQRPINRSGASMKPTLSCVRVGQSVTDGFCFWFFVQNQKELFGSSVGSSSRCASQESQMNALCSPVRRYCWRFVPQTRQKFSPASAPGFFFFEQENRKNRFELLNFAAQLSLEQKSFVFVARRLLGVVVVVVVVIVFALTTAPVGSKPTGNKRKTSHCEKIRAVALRTNRFSLSTPLANMKRDKRCLEEKIVCRATTTATTTTMTTMTTTTDDNIYTDLPSNIVR